VHRKKYFDCYVVLLLCVVSGIGHTQRKGKKKTKNCVKKADAAAAACLVTGEENG
jgi:hypothetical protein